MIIWWIACIAVVIGLCVAVAYIGMKYLPEDLVHFEGSDNTIKIPDSLLSDLSETGIPAEIYLHGKKDNLMSVVVNIEKNANTVELTVKTRVNDYSFSIPKKRWKNLIESSETIYEGTGYTLKQDEGRLYLEAESSPTNPQMMCSMSINDIKENK